MSNQLRSQLAANVRHLMTETALASQRRVGERSGVAQSTVGRILACEVSATIDNVEAIANAFGVSPVALLTPAANEASGTLATLFTVVQGMPQAALEKVLTYARFIGGQTVEPSESYPTLSLARTSVTTDAERGAIQRGARAPVRQEQEFNGNAKQQQQPRRGARKAPRRNK